MKLPNKFQTACFIMGFWGAGVAMNVANNCATSLEAGLKMHKDIVTSQQIDPQASYKAAEELRILDGYRNLVPFITVYDKHFK